jgi:hypothetical protein
MIVSPRLQDKACFFRLDLRGKLCLVRQTNIMLGVSMKIKTRLLLLPAIPPAPGSLTPLSHIMGSRQAEERARELSKK